jgi:hypothetical protein
MTGPTEEQVIAMSKIALVIDNEVVDVMYCQERLASILLSNPLVLDVSERILNEKISIGYFYNPESNTFAE